MTAPNTYIEYRKLYEKYTKLYGSTCAIFYQVGSFFELYDVVNRHTGTTWCNVKEVVELLGIQLTIKEGTDDATEFYFAGFPEYTLHRWAAKLTQQGWTVVVVEQKKDIRGKVELREVTRVLSPGTHSESATSEAVWIAAIWLEEQPSSTPNYGLTAIDLTTGQTSLYEGHARGKHSTWSADEAIHFFQIFPPRELLFLWRGDPTTQPSEGAVRRMFGISAPIHFRQALPSEQNSLEKSPIREALLQKHYQPKTLLPIREYLHVTSEFVERALCNLLRFIEDHFSVSSRLNIPTQWNSSTRLSCGNNALAQLNFIGDSKESVLGIFNKCKTAMGKRAIRTRLLMPLIQKESIEQRLNRVESLLSRTTPSSKISQILSLMFDLPRLHRKLMNYSLTGGDVLALYQTYTQISKLATCLPDGFDDVTPKPHEMVKVIREWETVFSVEKAEKASDNISFLRAGICPKIDEIERAIAQLYEEVTTWMAAFGQADLKIEEKDKQPISVRGPKTVITMIKDKSKPAGKDYENLTCNITKSVGHSLEAPFLNRINEKILGLRAQLAATLQSVLPDICITFYKNTGALWGTLEEFVEEVDCCLCFALVAEERGFFRPTILCGTASSCKAKALRHPLIEALPSRTKYVAHDVCLSDDSRGWLLYGMNASGKSSLMKAIGIGVLLAQCGSYVPAQEFSLVPFERLMTRILNVDNLWAGLSSFAVEVSELRDIFTRADNRTLVLGDELCSGTESVSATALVAAGIQYLLKKQSRFVFATHYHDLLRLPAIAEAPGLSIWHLKVRYEPIEDILIYERTLHPGAGSTLYGIEVAKALGMPTEILEESIKFRRALQGERVEEELAASAWNTNIVVRACELCGCTISRDLEVHHIRPRAEATNTVFQDGEARDSTRNLIVVCSTCHENHHSGRKPISPAKDTSVGIRRDSIVSDATSITPKKKHSTYSSEELEIIQKTIEECGNLPLKMIRFKLLNTYNIQISEAFLRTCSF